MILDSSVLVDIDKGKGKEKLEKVDGKRFSISAATLMELSVGKYQKNVPESRFRKVYENLEIIPIDEKIADKSGMIMSNLLDSGERIEINDIYIAATALVLNELVLTSNVDHFQRVDDVNVLNWNEL